MKRILTKKLITAALTGLLACGVCIASYGETVTELTAYPGVKTFDFASDPVRENVAPESMVDPEYIIDICRDEPDEYFGAEASESTDSSTGQTMTGIKLGITGTPGECGCIYRRLFKYRDQWIDVKTVYEDWKCNAKKNAFMSGGFAKYRWKALFWVKMRHEFYLSGTDTPVDVKGFLIYRDLDNWQGLIFTADELKDVWANTGGTILGYTAVPEGTEHVQNNVCSYTFDRDTVVIQSTTIDDIKAKGEEGYDAETAAKTDFAFTFEADVMHVCLVDNECTGINILNVSSEKSIPSSLPDGDSDFVSKTVSDSDEENVTENTVEAGETLTYTVKAAVPLETEPGNFYEGFSITDHIDRALQIKSVNIVSDTGEDVTELFHISEEGNTVTASVISADERDLYGHVYYMNISAEAVASGKNVTNVATVTYRDGASTSEVETNETLTHIKGEVMGTVRITKKIRVTDLLADHGTAVFPFRLEGTLTSGETRIFNGQITITGDYAEENTDASGWVSGTVTFDGLPPGQYVCTEYSTLRFTCSAVSSVSGGSVSGDSAVFNITDDSVRSAVFENSKTDWRNYSDSSVVVNRIGTADI